MKVDLFSDLYPQFEEYLLSILSEYAKQINASFEISDISRQNQTRINCIFSPYGEMTLKYTWLDDFIPQIQVIDAHPIKNKDIIRISSQIVFKSDGKFNRSSIIAFLTCLTGSLKETIKLLGLTPKLSFPDDIKAIANKQYNELFEEDEVDERILSAFKALGSNIVEFDHEWPTWLAILGSGIGKKVTNGLNILFRTVAHWVLDIHNPTIHGSLVEDIVNVWLNWEETHIWKKRLRLLEHLVLPARTRLIDMLLKEGKNVNVVFTQDWYSSGLFVYRNISNLLGDLALRTRTTLKGPEGFKNVPTELRLFNEEMLKLKLCPIDTGDRDTCGVVHFYTDRYLDENIVLDKRKPTLREVFVPLVQNIKFDDVQQYTGKNPIFKILRNIQQELHH